MRNNLLSFYKNLNSEFVRHIENTESVYIYKLGSHSIPNNVIFPNANNVTLINCSTTGIHNILHSRIFPNIKTINYLSVSHNNDYIYNRFNKNIKWIFPDKNYDYYNWMVKNGYGIKKVSLLNEYITNKKIINGKTEFDIIVPNYGIVNGNWWREQFYEYIVRQNIIESYKDCIYPGEDISNSIINQEIEELEIEKEIVAEELYRNSFIELFEDS